MERVLLLEDNAVVCRVLARLVRESFECTTAATLQEALTELRTSTWDIVLADLHLPDARGPDVERAIAEASPASALVLMSGENLRTGHGLHAPVLLKPFGRDALFAALERASASRLPAATDVRLQAPGFRLQAPGCRLQPEREEGSRGANPAGFATVSEACSLLGSRSRSG
jgi:CheY-like chemotaxis protein